MITSFNLELLKYPSQSKTGTSRAKIVGELADNQETNCSRDWR